jgi:midasin
MCNYAHRSHNYAPTRSQSHALTIQIRRHSDFRLFACMNPPTDVGKKDLPTALRGRFTEIFVDEIESESDLRDVVVSYLGSAASMQQAANLVSFYLEARALARKGDLFDGANQRAHYNLRSLTRTLQYACFMLSQGYAADRALYEGVQMVFATQLAPICAPLINKAISARLTPTSGPAQGINQSDLICVGAKEKLDGVWLRKGPFIDEIPTPKFVLTPSVQHNLRCVARAVAPGKYPVLLQGPTSAGKTSMIEYLAAVSPRIHTYTHACIHKYCVWYECSQDVLD